MKKQQFESFEAYCIRKGINAELPDVSSFPEEIRQFMLDVYKLTHICKAENGEWKADWTDHNQKKYFPWLILEKTSTGRAGVAARDSDLDFGGASSSSVSRLCLCDRSRCDFVRDNFIDLWISVLNG